MLSSIDDFLGYWGGINARTVRDVAALPPEASGWMPPSGEEERGWGPNQLIAHIVSTRDFFVRAYCGEGWIAGAEPDTSDPGTWVQAVEESGRRVQARLWETPDEWLQRDVKRLGGEETLAGWDVLMRMVEHEVHHRSQLDTYAGLSGWEPPQIYGRSWETVLGMQAMERERLERGGQV